MHMWNSLGILGSHSHLCLIVPGDACWDPNIGDIAPKFGLEPDYVGLSTKMRVLVPERA